MDFNLKQKALFEELGEHKKMVLSTSLHDHVTSRMMSVIIHSQQFYFQTDQTFRKYEQLMYNQNAALCADNIQVEGAVREIGWPPDHTLFCSLFQTHFPGSYQSYSHLQNERLFVLTPLVIRKWIYEDGKTYVEEWDFEKQAYSLIPYEGI